jgi:hypothetical protein
MGTAQPVVGDVTAARTIVGSVRLGVPEAERDALYDVIRARRDVRRFRPDAVAPTCWNASWPPPTPRPPSGTAAV